MSIEKQEINVCVVRINVEARNDNSPIADDMDLANSLSNLSQASTMSKVQIAVAKKVMDNQKMQGQAALELLNAASQNVGEAGDALVAAATGLGSKIDTYG